MSFAQFLSILRARKWAALAVFAVVVLATLAISLLLPKQYKGEASVVIDVKPDPITSLMNPAAAMPSFMATQVDILTSDRVALRVIRDLKINESAELRQKWQDEAQGQGTFEQYLVNVLQRGLDVKPSRESNVINVSYKSADPRFAAGLANAFAQAYIDTTLELRAGPAQNFRKFFDAQTKEARDALEKAQAKLSAYQQDKGIVATDERLDIESARLNELNSQLTQLQAVSAESRSRDKQAQGGQADRLQEVITNPVIGGLKVELSRAEAKLKELGSRLGDANPQVIEAKASINELRARLEAETKRVSGGVGVNASINVARVGEVRAALDAQREKVLKLKAERDEATVLQREVESAQRVFDLLINRLNQSGLEAQNTQSYASMLTVAQPPVEHASPKLTLNLALALFVGALLALGTALLLELTDRRVRSPEDVVAALGLPVIGSLPKPGAKRYKPARPSLPTLNHALHALPGSADQGGKL